LIVQILLLSPSYVEAQSDTNDELSVEELASLSLFDLAKVKVTTASKRLQVVDETPSTVRVISAKQIFDRGYLTLEDALSDLPGFQFRNIVGFNSYTFQRGIPNQNNLILVLVDGIQINELNSGGFYGGGQYNLSNIDRIEVVYGPASALYGTNAISGIVNLITKKPEDNKGFDLSGLYGSFDTFNADMSYGYYNEDTKLGVRISGMYKQTEKADLTGNKGDNNWSEDMENFEDDLSFDTFVTYRNFEAGLIVHDKQASRTTNYRSVNSNYLDSGTNWHIRFINSFLKHVYSTNKRWAVSSQLYYRNTTVLDNTIGRIDTSGQYGYYRPNDLIGFESSINYSITEKLIFTAGFVLENENLAEGFSITESDGPDEEPSAPQKPNMESNNLQSLYVLAQQNFLDYLQLSAGLRLDNSSVYDQVLTPRISLVYNKKSLTAKLLYMEAFRAPKPWDYNFGIGNSELDPEHMRSTELFLVYDIKDDLRFETSLYSNIVYDVLEKDTGNDRWINHGTLNTNGVEFTLSYYSNRITPYFNYTYNDSRDDNGDESPEIANHSANIGALYSISNKLRLNVSGNYLGERKNPHIIPNTDDDIINPAFVLHSVLTFTYSQNYNFQLIGKNILDTKYYHTSNSSVSRYRQPQRTILLRVGWSI